MSHHGSDHYEDSDDDFMRSKKDMYHVFQKILLWGTLATMATTFLIIIPVLTN